MGTNKQNETIDFVITWVDGGDPAWRAEKALYNPDKRVDDCQERYRDWEMLKYWFRGVEQFAPWVRYIHFVTWGHVPEWLDTTNPKLRIVNHKAFMPEEQLPVFNSNAIEMYLHRIPGLSERFVYFNDDMFLMKPVKKTDFFKDGKPVDMMALQPVVANPKNEVMSHLYLNNTLVLSRHFVKRENIRKQPGKYYKFGYPLMYFVYNLLELAFPLFSGFYTVHGPSPTCKKTMEEVWRLEPDVLEQTGKARFRSETDVTPYLFREWQKLSGEFCAKNVQKMLGYFNVGTENTALLHTIRHQKKKILCINDANEKIDFEKAKSEILGAFQEVLPQKSAFEK